MKQRKQVIKQQIHYDNYLKPEPIHGNHPAARCVTGLLTVHFYKFPDPGDPSMSVLSAYFLKIKRLSLWRYQQTDNYL